jgi:NitT/TauT family transport system ATP-binding protein
VTHAGRQLQLSLEKVGRAFGSTPVLDGVDLTVHRGEFLTLFGPNGCGKTTLLNVIAGVEQVDTGCVRFHEQRRPRVGYVFQDYRGNMLPWMTVAENIGFPLLLQGVPPRERHARVEALHALYGFNIDLGARTYTLSGGQAQLTSILRGLVIEPDMLIMDEPFSALDYQTNLDLYGKLLRVWRQSGATVLLVSHDIDEALYLGERTVFLTRRPARVAAVLESGLPPDRDIDEMASEGFATLKGQALAIFRREAALRTGESGE